MSADVALEAIWPLVAEIPGWLTEGQARKLFAAAARVRDGDTIVEIGSFRGRSTVVLATAAPSGAQVVAIEPHAGNDRGPGEIEGYSEAAATDHEVFLANLAAAGVADRVRHVRAFSQAAHADVPGEIAVLYIDGAHRYAPARRDIQEWGARVSDGGTLLIHDSFSSVGVTAAIARSLMFGKRFRYVGRARSMTIYRAEPSAGVVARSVSALRQLLQLPWFAKNLLIKVLITLRLGKLWRLAGRPEPEWPY